jgi:hypothetical protein
VSIILPSRLSLSPLSLVVLRVLTPLLHIVHTLSGDITLHKRTLEPIKTLIYGLRRYDLERSAALIDTSAHVGLPFTFVSVSFSICASPWRFFSLSFLSLSFRRRTDPVISNFFRVEPEQHPAPSSGLHVSQNKDIPSGCL